MMSRNITLILIYPLTNSKKFSGKVILFNTIYNVSYL